MVHSFNWLKRGQKEKVSWDFGISEVETKPFLFSCLASDSHHAVVFVISCIYFLVKKRMIAYMLFLGKERRN